MMWQKCSIEGVLLRKIERHVDNRGLFFEEMRQVDLPFQLNFVQDSISISHHSVLRGMHSQLNQWQLVTVIEGFALDVLCDLRDLHNQRTENLKIQLGLDFDQILIPPGVAHGFYVLSQKLILKYKSTEYFDVSQEKNFHWQSFNLSSLWPKKPVIISEKDQNSPKLNFFDY